MQVDRIALTHFRNYDSLQMEFHPAVNVIYGDNAQGKTNLLESVSFLSGLSPRTRLEREMIQFGQENACVKGQISSRGRTFAVEISLRSGCRKHVTANGVRLKNTAELSSILRCVLFCPDDLFLIRQGAAARRKFMDDCICQLRPRYHAAVTEYRRLYEQKSAILRDYEEKPSFLDTLDDFSYQMAQVGAVIIHYRSAFVHRLQQTAPPIHQSFSGNRECLTLRYRTVSAVEHPDAPRSELASWLWQHQQSHRAAELAARQCLSGPHKDDLLVDIGGISAKTFASQGQTRTAALSLKLAARDIFFQDSGEYPVLLLDDVLSELDTRRQEFVLNRLAGGQVFITCCENDRLGKLLTGQVFHIQNGGMT